MRRPSARPGSTPLAEHIEAIRGRLDASHAAREAGLSACRSAIRASANAIRAAHRQEWDVARERVADARRFLDDARLALEAFPQVYHAGFIHDAEKEYAEAMSTLSLLSGEDLPAPEVLPVGDAAYLNGLAEAIGELRRFLLDRLREGEFSRGEELLEAMDEIHDHLASLDYPDAITAGLRRSTDVARGILERTRGDLTASVVQGRLTRALGGDASG